MSLLMNFFNEFKEITNEFQALGKDVMDAEMNYKVLRSLLKQWNSIIHPLEIVHDINTQKFQVLMGILKNSEIKL